MTERYPFKNAVIEVSLNEGIPSFEFSSDQGEVRISQFVLWRDGLEDPLWSIVADNPPQEYSPQPDQPYPENERQLLEAMFHECVARMASGEGSIAVQTLRYGHVPAGFRQQRPPREAPPVGLSGGTYFLSAAGEYMGTATFNIERP